MQKVCLPIGCFHDYSMFAVMQNLDVFVPVMILVIGWGWLLQNVVCRGETERLVSHTVTVAVLTWAMVAMMRVPAGQLHGGHEKAVLAWNAFRVCIVLMLVLFWAPLIRWHATYWNRQSHKQNPPRTIQRIDGQFQTPIAPANQDEASARERARQYQQRHSGR